MKNVIVTIVLAIVLVTVVLNIANQFSYSTVSDCKVEKLVEQDLLGGNSERMKTEIRYLIVTDKGTFISESSYINLKFNNSDIFFHLKEG